METVARLEQENDDHAQEVLSLCQTIMKMRDQVDLAEDKTETLNSLLLQARTRLIDSEEHREQLTCELKNLKVYNYFEYKYKILHFLKYFF